MALVNDRAVFVTANSIDKTLRQAIIDGDIGGGSQSTSPLQSLIWYSDSNSPINESIDGIRLKSFDSVSSQELFSLFIVPSNYQTGSQIVISGASFFLNSSSGDVLFKTESTLIKSGSILGIYPNKRTSTNSEVSAKATLNEITDIGDLDLSSSIGEINGEGIVSGDKILIKLFRDNVNETLSATSDARLLIDGLEVKFL
jgi:hypothetical protein